jgi:hypothetical protein
VTHGKPQDLERWPRGSSAVAPQNLIRMNEANGVQGMAWRGASEPGILASLTPNAVASFVPSNDLKADSLFSEENSLIRRLNSLFLQNNSLFG